jgi:hypothetical protein
MNFMEIGDEWIYRQRPYSPSERVRIISIEKRKQTTRVDIEFLDGCRTVLRVRVEEPQFSSHSFRHPRLKFRRT